MTQGLMKRKIEFAGKKIAILLALFALKAIRNFASTHKISQSFIYMMPLMKKIH